ncbi:MAG: polyphosphate polymerase domain-containing protein [Spirosomataceae bacterium]
MTEESLQTIAQKATLFEPITLAEMESVKLMNRTDAKFLIPLGILSAILEDLRPHYRILEVNGHRLAEYETLYFDTTQLRLYHEHQSGRLNRYKIRQRNYVQSNLIFTEVKFKNNKGRTIKSRVRQQQQPGQAFEEKVTGFLRQKTPLDPGDLQPVLWVDYSRLTLVSRTASERLTLDLNLTFRHNHYRKSYEQVVVAEVKQESLKHSFFLDLMKHYKLREGSISKYCLGIMSLYKSVKHNRFKLKFNHLQKIARHHDFPARTHIA